MREKVMLVDAKKVGESTMRNRRFIEYIFVLVLIIIIIFQWISLENLERKWLSQSEDIQQQTKNIFRQDSMIAEQSKRIENMVNKTIKLSLKIQGKESYHNKPTIYAITPTFARPVQKAELTRLAQTFMHVPNFHWIIVEDSSDKTTLVSNLLKETGMDYTHLIALTPSDYKLGKNDPNWKKPRGVEQRNIALKWIRDHLNSDDNAIVFFADDDNTYSIKLFEEMEKIKRVGVWPVGLVGGLMVEKPICNKTTNKVIGFNSAWKPERPFPIDMAGFALNAKLLFDNKDAWFSFEIESGHQESEILRQITTRDQLEPLADFCTKVFSLYRVDSRMSRDSPCIRQPSLHLVCFRWFATLKCNLGCLIQGKPRTDPQIDSVYVWHTRTEPPKLSAEQLLIKKGKRSNEGIEV